MAKNKFIEKMREASKRWKKTQAFNEGRYRSWDPKLGIKVYHLYGGEYKKDKGWWDDTAFIEGSQQVSVAWVHPRMRYSDECDEIAWKETDHLYPRKKDQPLFEIETTNYKYLGKNKKRKRAVSHTMKPASEEFTKYYEILDAKKKEVQKTGDVVTTCSMSVEQLKHCRWVEICYPIEVVDEASLKEMADFVRACIRDRSLFDRTWGEYKYTKEDWNRELPEG
jgi:hypothetical protein